MSENSVPCPCSDCKGKEVSRHIRRKHIRKISSGVEQNIGKSQDFSSLLVAEKKRKKCLQTLPMEPEDSEHQILLRDPKDSLTNPNQKATIDIVRCSLSIVYT